ncbi:PHD finger domain protein [Aspergillus sclerotialis]|uniref:Chromatin modification-related protein n=1 Tax=Aspergillus sclerotialis TaxID=2070753 RepID=A0A3A2Z9H3_9EURO|nr:PHD finger domain protein [Aspergillus sclerotialis]
MADDSDNNGGVILDGPFDPDAQATVTDYIDYTEFLPADLMRSLTLIGGLDERYIESTQAVHELTKTFGQLPNLPADERPTAQSLRRDISIQLDRALNARESAYAEACRLYDVVDRHFNRLDCIKQKLNALPKPSSEPTPPQPTKRSRSGKKGDAAPTTRITLRLDGDKKGGTQKSRTRRSLASSGHLAPLNPDSPIASTEQSDAEPESKPEQLETPVDGEIRTVSSKRRDKQARRPRETLSASAPQAISTSNALALLKPPTEDAKPGSPDMPWLRLTEWEMTNLRRKMKKNSVWQPSEVMVHRELALRGRGWEAYRAAKAEAERRGEDFLDCDDIMNTYIPGQLTRKGEGTRDGLNLAETKLSNRGMKLNEAKRLKRENMAREQAAAAAAEAEAAKRGGAGSAPKGGLLSPSGQPTESPGSPVKGKSTRASKKRKHEEESAVHADTQMDVEATGLRTSTKRQKVSKEVGTRATATTVAESDIKRSRSPVATKRTSTRAMPTVTAAPRHTSLPKNMNTPTPPGTRPSSRRLSATHLADVPSAPSRDLRRKSATPARKTPIPEGAPSRRRKRPAPGPVSSGQDGGAAVSYGRRKAKPTKKKVLREQGQKETSLPPNQGIRIDEDGVWEEIDPNEPRYCVCGDVSFGTMICCENPDCDREWFHLDCVGLSEVPSRTAKWYCPDCRVKFNKGTDGIVRAGSRR